MKTPQEIFLILSEGNPNSLGRLLEVFVFVKSHLFTIEGLIDLYEKEDRYVSMRISNILKRLWREDSKHIIPHVSRLIDLAKLLKNPTFRWTLAQIYDELIDELSFNQQRQLLFEIQRNLELNNDWIMLTQSLKALQKAIKNGNRVIIANPTIESLKNHSSKVVKTNALKLIALLK